MYKKEIERKWLVNNDKLPNLSQYQCDIIKQGYLSQEHDSLEVRVRSVNNNEFYLMLKDSGSKIRNEITYEISKEEFEISYLLAGNKIIEKNRYKIPSTSDPSKVLELDHFINENFFLVEYEGENEIDVDTFIGEEWFGEEVTENNKYKNSYIAYDKN